MKIGRLLLFERIFDAWARRRLKSWHCVGPNRHGKVRRLAVRSARASINRSSVAAAPLSEQRPFAAERIHAFHTDVCPGQA